MPTVSLPIESIFHFFNWMKTIKVAVLQFETEITLINLVSWWPKADNSSDEEPLEGEGGTPLDADKFNVLHSHPKLWTLQVEGTYSLEGLVTKQQKHLTILLSKLGYNGQKMVLLAGAAHQPAAPWLASTRAAGMLQGHQQLWGDFLATETRCLCRPLLLCLRARISHAEREKQGRQKCCLQGPRDRFMVLCLIPSGSRKLCFSKRGYFLWTQKTLWPGSWTEQLLAPSSAAHACSREVLRTEDRGPAVIKMRSTGAACSLPAASPQIQPEFTKSVFWNHTSCKSGFFFQI